jgi:ribosome-binding ATPase YchF (GTP1/OBG family)
VDPISDIEVIQTELCLADMGTVDKALHRYTKAARRATTRMPPSWSRCSEKCQAALNEGKPVRALDFSKEEQPLLKQLCLITAKPAMFVGNVSEDGFENNPYLDRLKEYAASAECPRGGHLRQDGSRNGRDERRRPRHVPGRMGQDEPGLNRLIRAAFKLLGLQTYFTAGVKEVRAWTIHIGDTGPQAAGVIHTDFERGYIRAQTIAFDDFISLQGRAGRQGRRQDARRRQGIRGQRRRRDELPVQRLSTVATEAVASAQEIV